MKTRVMLFRFFAAMTTIPMVAYAFEIAIPSPDEMVKRADIILIGHFADPASGLFSIDEKLKAPGDISGTILVGSTYPEAAFSLKRIQTTLAGEQTILLGKWDTDKKAVMALFISSSFWPQGVPPTGEPRGTLPELRSFILKQLGKPDTVAPNVPPTGGSGSDKKRADGSATAKITVASGETALPESKREPTLQAVTKEAPIVPRWLWVIAAAIVAIAITSLALRARKK